MNHIRHKYLLRQICRRIAGFLLAFAAVLPLLAVRAEKANVFFIHGANVSEQDARAWAAEMFKRLWQAGANMEFHPNHLGRVTSANYGRIGEKLNLAIGLSIKTWFNPRPNDTNLEDARAW